MTLILTLILVLTFITPASAGVLDYIKDTAHTVISKVISFLDARNTDWFYDNVNYLVGRGGISGYPDGSFAPNKTISKAEFVKIAIAVATPDIIYPAAKAGEHWAKPYFNEAQAQKIVLNNEMPNWDEPITRFEMARVMVRVLENIVQVPKVATMGVDKLITDYGTIKAEFKPFVDQAYMKGLITGMDAQGTFAGAKTGTRAEAATMISRMPEPANRVKVKLPESTTRFPVLDQYEETGITKVEQLTPEVVEALKELFNPTKPWTVPGDAEFAEHKKAIEKDFSNLKGWTTPLETIVISKDFAWMIGGSALINGEKYYSYDWHYVVIIDGKRFARAEIYYNGRLKAAVIPEFTGHQAKIEFQQDWSMDGTPIYSMIEKRDMTDDRPRSYPIKVNYSIKYQYSWTEYEVYSWSETDEEGNVHVYWDVHSWTETRTNTADLSETARLLVTGTGVDSKAN